MRSLLATGRGAQITSAGAVLQGEGGRGKTTLARYYAETSRELYDGGLWALASDASSLMQSLAAFGKSAFDMDIPQAITPAHAEAVLHAIGTCGARLLFVYDNVDDYTAIKPFFPKGEHIDLIVTTRLTTDVPGFGRIALDVLDHDAPDSPAVKLLLQEAGQWKADADTRAAAQRLAADLGGLPLALIVAGALAKEGTDLDTLRARIAEIVETAPGQGGDYGDSVAAAVRLSLDTLTPDARALADVCAWLDPDRIDERLFTDAPGGDWWQGYKGDVPEEMERLAADGARVRAALRGLRQRSLLQEGEQGLTLHRLTAAVLRREAADPQVPARAAAVLLRAGYPYDADDPAHWDDCRRLTPHVVTLWGEAGPFWREAWGQPNWPAMDSALNQCGVFLSSQRDDRSALVLRRAALEMIEPKNGNAGRNLPAALCNLSLTLSRLGEFEEAEECADQAISLTEARPSGTENLARICMQKANILFRRAEAGDRAELDSAEGWIDKARAILETLAEGQPSEGVAICLNDLGYLRRLQGRGEEAAEAYQAALDIRRQVPGVNRASLATSAVNVGSSWLEAGRADRALRLLQEAHGIHAEIFDDPQAPALRASAGWLFSCLLTLARAGQDPEANRAEAERLCRAHGLDWAEHQRLAEQYRIAPPEA